MRPPLNTAGESKDSAMAAEGIGAEKESIVEKKRARKIRTCLKIKVVQVLGKKESAVLVKSLLLALLPQAELKFKTITGVKGGNVLTKMQLTLENKHKHTFGETTRFKHLHICIL